jgi:cytochrome c peroxidase
VNCAYYLAYCLLFGSLINILPFLFLLFVISYGRTNAQTTFSNEFFRVLLQEKWTLKKIHEGKQWSGPQQYEDKTGALMMLPADLALIEDKDFRKYIEVYAKDEKLFFDDFASAFSRLLELGVDFNN